LTPSATGLAAGERLHNRAMLALNGYAIIISGKYQDEHNKPDIQAEHGGG